MFYERHVTLATWKKAWNNNDIENEYKYRYCIKLAAMEKKLSTAIGLVRRLTTGVNDNLVPESSPQDLLSPTRSEFRAKQFLETTSPKLRFNDNLVDESSASLIALSLTIFKVEATTRKSAKSWAR